MLIDFGIARVVSEASNTKKTSIGTQGYAPVEQCRGQVEPRSDLYALGATIHHLITGIDPIPFKFEPLRNIVPSVSIELEQIVIKALKDNLQERFSSAKEMRDTLPNITVVPQPQSSMVAVKPVQNVPVPPTLPVQVVNTPQPIAVTPQPQANPVIPVVNATPPQAVIKPVPPIQVNQIVSPTKEIYTVPAIQNSYIEPEMVYIKGGTFLMGSNNGNDNERPVHSVTVSSFYIGKYEVTNSEYLLYYPHHISRWYNDNYPVSSVNWYDAVDYCKWLSSNTGKTYRLPTEAEWEYACRAGSKTDYYWWYTIDNYCWYGGNSGNKVHPVGKKKPNKFGLYDMSGNVHEFCSDWYEDYPSDSIKNPVGPSSGSFKIYRGGCFGSEYDRCRSAARGKENPYTKYERFGFRLVREP